MNYLAHLYLAGDDEELIVGNFVADSVKGSAYLKYPKRIAQGIQMHRSIDFFSDTHPVYRKSVHRLSPIYGKFSGVITDMFYDHFLALMWNNYCPKPLEIFAKDAYSILLSYQAEMPEKSRVVLTYMSKYNWLVSYSDKEGIRRSLKGMSERMKYYSPMDEAVNELEKDFELYKQDFLEFFPLLQSFAEELKA
ncbi:MAG: ACP phosphodiesterase [Bacteroidia bacterium]